MLNYIWAFMILVGIVYAAFTGNMAAVTDAALSSAGEAVSLCITMAGVMALWMGLMKIAEKSGLIARLTTGIQPLLSFLFPDIPKKHEARQYIATNFIANILGLGWACTPAGLKAMEALAKLANYKGNVAIMIGNLTDAGALQRTKDVEQVVAKYPAMKVVQKQPANYSRSEGMDLMQNWTGNGEAIDIVAANNDEMAIGAAMALEKSQKKLLIGGIDATPDGLKALASDKIQVTVFQDAVGQGKTALAVALKLIKGEKVESHVWIPFELVTKENMQTYVEKSH